MKSEKEISEKYIYLILIIPAILILMPSEYTKALSIYLNSLTNSPSMIGFTFMTISTIITFIIYILKVKSNEKKGLRHSRIVQINESFIVVFGLLFTIVTGTTISLLILL